MDASVPALGPVVMAAGSWSGPCRPVLLLDVLAQHQVFNDAPAIRRAACEAGEPYISDRELSARLTASKDTPERSWLASVSSVVLQQGLADLGERVK